MRAAIFTASLAVAVIVAGCDKTTDPQTGSLTAEEARAIALAVDDGATAAVDSNSPDGAQLALSPSGPSLDVITHTGDFDVTKNCDVSGKADVVGESSLIIDGEAGTIDFEVTATADFTGCTFVTDEDVEIGLDGSVAFEALRHLSEGLITGSQSHTGSLDYTTSDGKAGTCPIDISTEFDLSEGSASRTVTGTVCEHTVNVTTTWTRT